MSEPTVPTKISRTKYYVRTKELTIFHHYLSYRGPGGSWSHVQFVIKTSDRLAGLDKMAEVLQKEWSGADTLWAAFEECKAGKPTQYFSVVLV